MGAALLRGEDPQLLFPGVPEDRAGGGSEIVILGSLLLTGVSGCVTARGGLRRGVVGGAGKECGGLDDLGRGGALGLVDGAGGALGRAGGALVRLGGAGGALGGAGDAISSDGGVLISRRGASAAGDASTGAGASAAGCAATVVASS